MNIEVYGDGRLEFGGKTYHCALGKAGIGKKQTEGDNVTPAGCYPLRQVFYRADRIEKPKTELEVRAIQPEDAWCDDPKCSDYNQLVKLPHSGSHEKLCREDDIYNMVVPISYNDNPVISGKGSAIFMHIARSGYPTTEGCVALAKTDLLEVLAQVDKNTRICFNKE